LRNLTVSGTKNNVEVFGVGILAGFNGLQPTKPTGFLVCNSSLQTELLEANE